LRINPAARLPMRDRSRSCDVFTENSLVVAFPFAGNGAGGIFNWSNATIQNSVIAGNTSASAGGSFEVYQYRGV
jgi:hypothetical protein